MLRNREDAEDVVQESFLRAYRGLASFDQPRPFRKWLYTIASNLALNTLRARQRRGKTVALDFDDDACGLPANTVPAMNVGSNELADSLAKAVGGLQARPAALVHLHYMEGMTIREAAEVLDMTEEAAKVALHRARKRLREDLSRNE